MNKRIIKAVLERKFKDFLSSIDDLALRELVAQSTIITGGSIVSLLLNEKVSDFDLYFRNLDVAYKVVNYYVDKFKANPPSKFQDTEGNCNTSITVHTEDGRIRMRIASSGVTGVPENDELEAAMLNVTQEDEAEAQGTNIDMSETADIKSQEKSEAKKSKLPRYSPIYITENAITLSNKMQLVVRFFGEPEEIHKNYDFVHCCNYWTSWDHKLVLLPQALEAILTRNLLYVGSKYPLCSLIRTRKFIRRGWNINAGQFLKMAYQIHKLDLSNIAVLQEQLIGVDTAYFSRLLEDLRAHKSANPGAVDENYLMELIDKIF